MGKKCGRWKNRKEHMTAPITVSPVDPETLDELRRRYEEAPKVENRTRDQMLFLALQGYKVPQIVRIALRREDTEARGPNRFLAGGLDSVLPPSPPPPDHRPTVGLEP